MTDLTIAALDTEDTIVAKLVRLIRLCEERPQRVPAKPRINQ